MLVAKDYIFFPNPILVLHPYVGVLLYNFSTLTFSFKEHNPILRKHIKTKKKQETDSNSGLLVSTASLYSVQLHFSKWKQLVSYKIDEHAVILGSFSDTYSECHEIFQKIISTTNSPYRSSLLAWIIVQTKIFPLPSLF